MFLINSRQHNLSLYELVHFGVQLNADYENRYQTRLIEDNMFIDRLRD